MSFTTVPGFDYVDDSECANASYTYSSTNLVDPEASESIASTKKVEGLSFPPGLTKSVEDLEDFSAEIAAPNNSEDGNSMKKEISQDCISVFLDMECGEPLPSQHLRVDFEPIPGVDDTDFLLRKCADFWKLVDGSKKLQELKAMPEEIVDVVPEKSSQSVVSEQGDHVLANHNAIHIIEKKGRMVDDCFMNQMRSRYCEAGSGDYFTDSVQAKPGEVPNWKTGRRCSRLRGRSDRGDEDLAKLCSELHQWDLEHPKCMDPPNHGPPHTYAVMRRN